MRYESQWLGRKTIQEFMKNYQGVRCKSQWLETTLLRISFKLEEQKKILFLFILWSIFLVVLQPSQYELLNRP